MVTNDASNGRLLVHPENHPAVLIQIITAGMVDELTVCTAISS